MPHHQPHHPHNSRLSEPPPQPRKDVYVFESSSSTSDVTTNIEAVESLNLESKPPSLITRHHKNSKSSPPCLDPFPRGCCRLKFRFSKLSFMASVDQHVPVPHVMVAELREELQKEEKVHEILRIALNSETTLAIPIPNFLPDKIKEILMELAMVEDEISRLEVQVIQTQRMLVEEQEARQASICTRSPRASTSNPLTIRQAVLTPYNPYPKCKSAELNPTMFETKSLFFINQAMNGFPSNGGVGSLQGIMDKKVEHERRKSGTLEKPSSPKPPPPKEKINKNSRSFRADGSLNLKNSLAVQRETAQQDPYGIFDIEGSIPRDIGPYKNFVRFTSSSVDVKGISNCLPLLKKLRSLMNCLHDVDLRFLSHKQKLAFWINTYNICIMHGFLQHGLPSKMEEVLALRDKAMLYIGGNKLNALAIEHFILRPLSTVTGEVQWESQYDFNEEEVQRIYGLDHPEPNVIFALCGATRSSPAVRIYKSDNVLVELEKAKLEYLQASIVVTASRRLMIPKMLVWNKRDFASDLNSLIEWICNQLPTSGSLRKSIGECLRGRVGNRKASDVVEIMPHDFEFQYLLVV
ncbi:hypothetical protein QJS04_geneDACA000312 [Acorus gramineus]|uniref:DUF547 domain-containing protein n=1 Tax=Acorus gramineus TaxID=55184 RepID=A0AAV9ATP6_ACOGR|nr:hypothetical protein QJS04_geneDACA000312 [Acorus gramineus]